MKRNIKIFILTIALIFIVTFLNVGYAKPTTSFSSFDSLFDNQTFNVQFKDVKVVKCVGANELKTYAKILPGNNSLSINVAELEYPGARAEFSVDIINKGSVPAKIESINVNGIDTTSIIKVDFVDYSNVCSKVLKPNEIQNIQFFVCWDHLKSSYSNCEINNFSLNINYVQADV